MREKMRHKDGSLAQRTGQKDGNGQKDRNEQK